MTLELPHRETRPYSCYNGSYMGKRQIVFMSYALKTECQVHKVCGKAQYCANLDFIISTHKAARKALLIMYM